MPEKDNERYEQIDMLDALIYKDDYLQNDVEFAAISDEEAQMSDAEIYEANKRDMLENIKKTKKGDK